MGKQSFGIFFLFHFILLFHLCLRIPPSAAFLATCLENFPTFLYEENTDFYPISSKTRQLPYNAPPLLPPLTTYFPFSVRLKIHAL